MNKKCSVPVIQNSFSKKKDLTLSAQEQQVLTAFFSLLYEINQQNNVSKEYSNAEQNK